MSDTKIPRYSIFGSFEFREDVNGSVCMAHDVAPLEEMAERLREAEIERRWPPKPDRTQYREALFAKVVVAIVSSPTFSEMIHEAIAHHALSITDAAIAALDA